MYSDIIYVYNVVKHDGINTGVMGSSLRGTIWRKGVLNVYFSPVLLIKEVWDVSKRFICYHQQEHICIFGERWCVQTAFYVQTH